LQKEVILVCDDILTDFLFLFCFIRDFDIICKLNYEGKMIISTIF